MGKIVDYWLEQLKPVTDLSHVTKNPFEIKQNISKPEINDLFFYSGGYDTSIKRYLQAKELYGMECNASTVMYMLQSYGLIAHDMTRKEFENAFTPLTPSEFSKGDFISIAGKKQKVRPIDLFSSILGEQMVKPDGFEFMKLSAAILRGVTDTRYPSPISPSGNAAEILNQIIDAFQNARKSGYNLSNTKSGLKSKSNFKNLYNSLLTNTLDSTYFKNGNTVYAGISTHYSSQDLSHYVLVVRDALSYLEKGGKKYYIYPVDDAWHKNAFLLVSNPVIDNIPINYWTDTYRNVTKNSDVLYYKNMPLFTISSLFAVGQ